MINPDEISDSDLQAIASQNYDRLSNDFLEKIAASGQPQIQVSQPPAESFDLATRSAPASGYLGSNLLATPIPKRTDTFGRGLLTNEPVSGLPANVGRYGPQAIGATLGSPIGPAGAILGAAGGEGIRQGLVNINAIAADSKYAGPGEVTGEMIAAAANQAAGELAFGLGRGVIAKARPFVSSATQYLGENLGKISRPAYEYARENIGRVFNPIAAHPETGADIAEEIRTLIPRAVQAGTDAYKAAIESALSNEKYGPGYRVNLLKGVGEKMASIKNEFGYGVPGRFGESGEGQRIFNWINGIVQNPDLTVEQAYYLQRDLNGLAHDRANSELGVALGKAAKVVGDYLGKKIPEIAEANAAYSAGQEIERQSKKLVGANDMSAFIRRVMSSPAKDNLQREQLMRVAGMVPEIGQKISEMQAHLSAQEFASGVRGLPQTGLGALAVQSVATAMGHGFEAIPAAAATLALGSPAAYGLALRAGAKIGPQFTRFIEKPAQSQAVKNIMRSGSTFLGAEMLKGRAAQ